MIHHSPHFSPQGHPCEIKYATTVRTRNCRPILSRIEFLSTVVQLFVSFRVAMYICVHSLQLTVLRNLQNSRRMFSLLSHMLLFYFPLCPDVRNRESVFTTKRIFKFFQFFYFGLEWEKFLFTFLNAFYWNNDSWEFWVTILAIWRIDDSLFVKIHSKYCFRGGKRAKIDYKCFRNEKHK